MVGCPFSADLKYLEVPCEASKSCDDGNPCTIDACKSGVCVYERSPTAPDDGRECTDDLCDGLTERHTPVVGRSCGAGLLQCDAAGECTGCTKDADCGGGACKIATCNADHSCKYDFKKGMPIPTQTPGDCKTRVCDGTGGDIEIADDEDVPQGGPECTTWHCVMGEPQQLTAPVGTACAGGSTYCNADQQCVPCTENAGCPAGATCFEEQMCVSCADGKANGDEADVDCGGSCAAKCADGQACNVNEDCVSNDCTGGTCISCVDGKLDGSETDVDCGGLCGACDDGRVCSQAADCASGYCVDGRCCVAQCDGTCLTCALPGSEGTCTFLPKGHDDANPSCSGGSTCNGFGTCVSDLGKGHAGAMCNQASDCFSNKCSGQPPKCQ